MPWKRTRFTRTLGIALAVTLFVTTAAHAQWPVGGFGTGATAMVPEAGSVFVAGNGAARRYSNAGALLQSTSFTSATAVPDGAGGFVALWTAGSPATQLGANRLTSTLTKPWGTNGVVLTTTFWDSFLDRGAICGDGTGVAFAAWTDTRANGVSGRDVYAQKVSAAGVIEWTANGVVMNTLSTNQQTPAIVSDGAGGCIVTWADGDIYAQRLDAAGTKLWAPNGQPIVFGGPVEDPPAIVTDGAGGAIIAWIDYRDGSADLYAQRINAVGVVQWAINGIAVAAPVGQTVRTRQVMADGAGGAILVWEQRPNGGAGDVYAQRVDGTGAMQWTPGGVLIASGSQHQIQPAVGPDGSGGAFIAWNDLRFGGSATFFQQVDAGGIPLLEANGLLIDLGVYPTSIVPDGSGGAYLLETIGGENFFSSVGHLQRVFAGGGTGWAPNYAASMTVMDEPSDQGGLVQLRFDRPLYEGGSGANTAVITSYNVWRRAAEPSVGAIAEATRPRVMAVPASSPRAFIESTPRLANGFPPGTWESMGSHPALRRPSYILTAPTHDDSTAAGPADEDFLISSQISLSPTSDVILWVVSSVASGHSVDNLPPLMPVNLAGSVTGAGTVSIHWQGGGERDLHEYRLYRGSDPGFAPGPASLLGKPVSPSWTDAGYESGVSHYKVCAVDVNGNVSEYALLTPGQITGVGGGIPQVSFLGRPMPNPARARVTLEFGLARSEHASLTVVDARGRVVRRLVDGDVAAGTQRWTWDGRDGAGRALAAGIYWVVLRTPSFKQVHRLAWLD